MSKVKEACIYTAAGLTLGAIVLGTVASANKARTARYGLQLPNQVLVRAFSDDDATLIRRMREYVKGFAK